MDFQQWLLRDAGDLLDSELLTGQRKGHQNVKLHATVLGKQSVERLSRRSWKFFGSDRMSFNRTRPSRNACKSELEIQGIAVRELRHLSDIIGFEVRLADRKLQQASYIVLA